ncbi:MAG TPA: EAL domain-containing protein [Burkholderiales bacterium]|nr:EAL domain-containing protein [Burkholderiales bacterium]
MSTSPTASPLSSASLESIRSRIRVDNGRATAEYANLRLGSHFQPIFSVAHSRIVGYEALMRAQDSQGKPIPPLEVFGQASDFFSTLMLDRISGAVHVQNFQRQNQTDGWLFLNVNAQVFLESTNQGDFFDELLKATGFPAHRIVTEVLEQGVKDEVRLVEAVQFFRSKGFLIALDDFGAGHSNFDRIWSLQPDIVKLDRSMIARAGSNLRIRRMMPVMVSLLHEAGSLVLMEGVETESEALIAMDADADFVQGYYFARPQADLPAADASRDLFDHLWQDFKEVTLPEVSGQKQEIGPYRNAIGYAASLLESGIPLAQAAGGFLQLPGAERCYLLDSEGRQIGHNIINDRHPPTVDKRYTPLLNADGANWSRRYYFRRALDHPGKVQVTRPYLSITGANQCITVSIGTHLNGEMLVLCGDVNWRDRGAVKR